VIMTSISTHTQKIFVLCPASYASGGPELLHQLSYHLIRLGLDAVICYVGDISPSNSPVHPQYESLKIPYVLSINDSESSLIVIPETLWFFGRLFPLSRKYLWWLSVDNFYKSLSGVYGRFIRSLRYFRFPICRLLLPKLLSSYVVHPCQSNYAQLHVTALGLCPAPYLSDYIADSILAPRPFTKRLNQVLYNPRKGATFTRLLIDLNPDISFLPLSNLTRSELVTMMSNSKLFIDFGEHPGKDRLPREACALGLCIITGSKGSAGNRLDLPIPLDYKFTNDSSNSNLLSISFLIRDILDNFENHSVNFNSYRDFIRAEKSLFDSSVRNVFV
jgi:hypothetical protein